MKSETFQVMKFCVSFVFFSNEKTVNRSAIQDKWIKLLLEPETCTGPSFVLFLSMEDMQNERTTNTNQGNESMLYSFPTLVAALLYSGIKITAIHTSEDALIQSTFARSRVEI